MNSELKGFDHIADRLRNFFEAMPVGMIVIGLDGIVVTSNQSVANMSGYGLSQCCGKSVASLFNGLEPGEDVVAALKKHCTNRICKTSLRKADGSDLEVELMASVFSSGGSEWLLLCIVDRTQPQVVM